MRHARQVTHVFNIRWVNFSLFTLTQPLSARMLEMSMSVPLSFSILTLLLLREAYSAAAPPPRLLSKSLPTPLFFSTPFGRWIYFHFREETKLFPRFILRKNDVFLRS